MIPLLLSISLSLNPINEEFTRLQTLYWDCDTMFMKNELHPQDMQSCLAITDQFILFFENNGDFKQYLQTHKDFEWMKRGYVNNKDDSE